MCVYLCRSLDLTHTIVKCRRDGECVIHVSHCNAYTLVIDRCIHCVQVNSPNRLELIIVEFATGLLVYIKHRAAWGAYREKIMYKYHNFLCDIP